MQVCNHLSVIFTYMSNMIAIRRNDKHTYLQATLKALGGPSSRGTQRCDDASANGSPSEPSLERSDSDEMVDATPPSSQPAVGVSPRDASVEVSGLSSQMLSLKDMLGKKPTTSGHIGGLSTTPRRRDIGSGSRTARSPAIGSGSGVAGVQEAGASPERDREVALRTSGMFQTQVVPQQLQDKSTKYTDEVGEDMIGKLVQDGVCGPNSMLGKALRKLDASLCFGALFHTHSLTDPLECDISNLEELTRQRLAPLVERFQENEPDETAVRNRLQEAAVKYLVGVHIRLLHNSETRVLEYFARFMLNDHRSLTFSWTEWCLA